MFRNCPKCKKLIKSSSALFCYQCGTILNAPEGKDLENDKKLLEPENNLAEIPQKKGKKFPKIAALIGVFIILLIGSYFGYVKFKDQNNLANEIVSPVDLEKEQKFEIDLSSLDVKLSTGTLNTSTLSQIAPVSVDSFLIINNPDTFYDNFIEDNAKVDINELTGLSVEEISSFLESSFSIITIEDSWAFIAKTKNKDFLETKLEELDTKDLEYQISLVGDFLIITNDVNILNEIENVDKGTSLSLSKDAFFVEATKNLPSEGAALVFYRDVNKIATFLKKVGWEEEIDPKGKNSFVAIKSGTGVILQF